MRGFQLSFHHAPVHATGTLWGTEGALRRYGHRRLRQTALIVTSLLISKYLDSSQLAATPTTQWAAQRAERPGAGEKNRG